MDPPITPPERRRPWALGVVRVRTLTELSGWRSMECVYTPECSLGRALLPRRCCNSDHQDRLRHRMVPKRQLACVRPFQDQCLGEITKLSKLLAKGLEACRTFPDWKRHSRVSLYFVEDDACQLFGHDGGEEG